MLQRNRRPASLKVWFRTNRAAYMIGRPTFDLNCGMKWPQDGGSCIGGRRWHPNGRPPIGTKDILARSLEHSQIGVYQMRLSVFALVGTTILATCTIAAADDNGALTGAAGGAVTGAVVGGPVGAVVGGAAGAVIGGATTGAPRPVVVEPAPAPCATRTTTQTNNNTGASRTTQTTDCAD
jgi:hypothetical protein